jgi:class 3 adenylate cyclase
VTCSSCATQNRPGRKFCVSCGAVLAAGCPACGAPVEPGERFCGECGAPLPDAGQGAGAGASAGRMPSLVPTASTGSPGSWTGDEQTRGAGGARLPQAADPVAERRLVSILFADLVGFTAWSAERDPEEVRELLTRYFELARDVVERYGGAVEKFIGDAVMAVWGAPTAREDDAERAVRAALELVDAVGGLVPGMSARGGVLTGEAAVTIGAVGQGMVAGDIVNTASRLQSVAPPGTVLVGDATRRAASGAIVFEEAGEQLLKGKTAPVAAFRVMRVVAERGGRNRSEALEAPFVGRADELRLLKDLFHATGRERRARLVSAVGPAGIGKSRLAWEFLKYVDGLMEPVWWHQGRSPSYGEGISFWALGEMVRARCGLLEGDDERTTREKVAATVAVNVPGEEDRRWTGRALLTLLGFESGLPPDQLFAAWRTFFESLAATGTVAMVFEDLHFADPGLLDFIDHLLEWSRTLPIYVLTLSRPELLEKRPDWGAGKRHFTSVYLEPLAEPAMRELLGGLVPGLPEDAARRIVARADGVPLYAVETVRMLVAEGRLALDGDRYVPTGDLTDLAVPETLTALIAARLDALDPRDRSLVQHASVLGQSFSVGALAAISGSEPAELDARLRALVRREMLTVDMDPRSPERGQYAFVQALIREVAYNTLAHRDRKERHLAAARYFESLGSEELAGALAGHYLAARANAGEGPEADALASQARVSLRAAGERAAGLGAYDHAEGFFSQAVSVAVDPAEQAELLQRATDAAMLAARHGDAERHIVRAIELRRAGGDRRATADAIAVYGRVLAAQYDAERGVALLETAIAEFADLAPDPVTMELDLAMSAVLGAGEQFERSLPYTERALAIAEQQDLVDKVVESLARRGAALATMRRAYEGQSLVRGAIALAESSGNTREVLRAKGSLMIMMGASDPASAMRLAHEIVDAVRRLGLRARLIGAVGNSAEVARVTGDWDWSVGEMDALLATALEPEDRIWLLANAGIVRSWRGEDVSELTGEVERLGAESAHASSIDLMDLRSGIAIAGGRFSEARELALATARVSPLNALSSLHRAAQAAVWDRDPVGAQADVEASMALGPRGAATRVRRDQIRAGIAALSGRTAEALAAYPAVITTLRDLGLHSEAAFAAIDMATVLDPAEPAVAVAVDAARETFARLGAVPFVRRLDELVSHAPTGTDRQPAPAPAD